MHGSAASAVLVAARRTGGATWSLECDDCGHGPVEWVNDLLNDGYQLEKDSDLADAKARGRLR